MRNSQKVAAAERVVAYAKSLGFTNARLNFADEDYNMYDSIDEATEEFGIEDYVCLGLHVVLDDLEFYLVEGENAEPTIDFKP
jgi:hypothetical protein